MTLARNFAALSALALIAIATPAAARPAEPQPDLRSTSICARNLAGAQCGRYQRQLIQATALRAGDRNDHATLREIGRRQLDQLIDSVS